MKTIKIMKEGYHCERCSHEWVSRKGIPGVCPRCHSHLWAVPKVSVKRVRA